MVLRNHKHESWFIFLALVTLPVQSMQIPQECVFAPSRLGELDVSFDGSSFSVNDIPVQNYELDSVLKEVKNQDDLESLLSNAKLSVGQYDSGEYKLVAMGGLKGGDPILAWAGYVLVKATVPVAMGVARYKIKKREKKQKKALKRYQQRNGYTSKDEAYASYMNEHYGSVSENVESFAGVMDVVTSTPLDTAIEEGSSYIIDEMGNHHMVGDDDTGSMFASVMMADHTSVAAAKSSIDHVANMVFEALLKVPNPFMK